MTKKLEDMEVGQAMREVGHARDEESFLALQGEIVNARTMLVQMAHEAEARIAQEQEATEKAKADVEALRTLNEEIEEANAALRGAKWSSTSGQVLSLKGLVPVAPKLKKSDVELAPVREKRPNGETVFTPWQKKAGTRKPSSSFNVVIGC